MPTIRSRLPVLIGSFVVAAVVVTSVALIIASSVGVTVSPAFIAMWATIGLGVGCLAVCLVVYLLFPRPLEEAWSLGSVQPERRAAVRSAVWRNDPGDLHEDEQYGATHYAQVFVRDTPHRLLQYAVGIPGIALILGAQLFNPHYNWVSFGTGYGIVISVVGIVSYRRRARQARNAADYLRS